MSKRMMGGKRALLLAAIVLASGACKKGSSTPIRAGGVYQFRIGYNTVQVGSPCGGQAGCKAIPAGVQALVDQLQALDKQQLALPPCATVFP